jgi:cytochrome c oxidase subunit 3
MAESSMVHEERQLSIEGEDSHHLSLQTQSMGMWVFLMSEIMFFGTVFAAYIIYRQAYPQIFEEASNHLLLFIGSFNTGILLTSSLCMALAVNAAARGASRQTAFFLLATIVLGVVFLGLKFYEYSIDFAEHLFPGGNFQYLGSDPARAKIFFSLYFTLTGMHAVHMIIGILMLSVLTVFAWRKKFSTEHYAPVEMIGLYWHFVDIVWIFIFPLMYLVGPK